MFIPQHDRLALTSPHPCCCRCCCGVQVVHTAKRLDQADKVDQFFLIVYCCFVGLMTMVLVCPFFVWLWKVRRAVDDEVPQMDVRLLTKSRRSRTTVTPSTQPPPTLKRNALVEARFRGGDEYFAGRVTKVNEVERLSKTPLAQSSPLMFYRIVFSEGRWPWAAVRRSFRDKNAKLEPLVNLIMPHLVRSVKSNGTSAQSGGAARD